MAWRDNLSSHSYRCWAVEACVTLVSVSSLVRVCLNDVQYSASQGVISQITSVAKYAIRKNVSV